MTNQLGHILIVDDNLQNLKILSEMLISQEYRVSDANSGKVALQKVKSDPPDLILLDIRIPDMSGYEVGFLLKEQENTKDIPIIFLSNLDSPLDKLEAFSSGGVDYISKPFNLMEVLARVEVHLQLRCLQTQLKEKIHFLETQNAILQYEVCDRLKFEYEFYEELKTAIERKEFQLYYQPIVDFNTGKVLSFEALLRWNHPKRGIVLPADFIPFAEATGLINLIGEWTIEAAIGQLKLWNCQFPENLDLAVSVNVSGYQLLDNSLFEYTKKALHESEIHPHKLQLEITESVLIRDRETTVEVLEKFKKIGLQLYLDDFGTGYSSLSLLYDLPIDVLKIDRSFVQKEEWIIVNAITKLATALDKDIIVEGIETLEQLTTLINMSCHRGQGYYFSKPVNAAKATEIISECLIKPPLELFCPPFTVLDKERLRKGGSIAS
ncbi:EAL domain-containing protein [Tumidithrix helvetica PCC 7403]|uniref:two-component system response regulator n=1 Tax=Tumidithrix helvetica TaxID=3457545 RepID=UPI003CAA2CF7